MVGSPSFSQSSSSAAVGGFPSQGSSVTSSVIFGLVSLVCCFACVSCFAGVRMVFRLCRSIRDLSFMPS